MIIILLAGIVLAGLYFLAPDSAVAPVAETVKTYTSKALGVQFQYQPKLDETNTVGIKEIGTKLYVYVGEIAPETGQSLELFRKDRNETLTAAIRRQILAKYPSELCQIEAAPSNILSGYQVAEISYPKPSDPNEPWFSNTELCNPQYDQTNGLRYFLYDPKHPERFYFLSIGQYGIPARGMVPWQDTLKITD